MVFKRTDSAPTLNRPQDPSKPYPYDEEEVTYRNTADNVKLAGTLTLPRDKSNRYPAVILITGSGSQDRNETIAGHRPFLVLADHLTHNGIAVLRVDDRGTGGSDRGSLNVTSENFMYDVLAGVEYLKTRKEIDPKKIGLVGHSEGGMIAPMAAVKSKDVAFIVLMAGLGQKGEDVIYTQTELLQHTRRRCGHDKERSRAFQGTERDRKARDGQDADRGAGTSRDRQTRCCDERNAAEIIHLDRGFREGIDGNVHVTLVPILHHV